MRYANLQDPEQREALHHAMRDLIQQAPIPPPLLPPESQLINPDLNSDLNTDFNSVDFNPAINQWRGQGHCFEGANAEGVCHSRGVRGHASPENFEI